MILDTSTLVAVLYGEPEQTHFAQLIHDADSRRVSVVNFVELSMVVESQVGADAGRQVDMLFRRAAIVIEPVTVEHGQKGPPRGRPQFWRLPRICLGQGDRGSAIVEG